MPSPYENRQNNIRKIKLPEIETWTNEYSDHDYEIHFTVSEFTCVCPKTGLPDFATINIRYIPDKNCIELKSFKEYILAYRDLGIFHEHVMNRLLDDFVKAAKPRKVEMMGDFNIRGGIKTIVTSSYENKNWGKNKAKK